MSHRGSAVCTIKPGHGDGGETNGILTIGLSSGGGGRAVSPAAEMAEGPSCWVALNFRPSGSWVGLVAHQKKSVFQSTYLSPQAKAFIRSRNTARVFIISIIDDDGSHRSTPDWSINLGTGDVAVGCASWSA
jgi:hypothetical protein